MSGRDRPSSPASPSTGYYVTFAAAMIGMVALAVAVIGTYHASAGGDPLDAFNMAGVPALIFAWALAFFARLMFSTRSSVSTRATVRNVVRLILALEILASVAGGWFVLTHGHSPDMHGIMIAGLLAQVGTLLWLVRYARP